MHPKRFARRRLFWGAILIAVLATNVSVSRGQEPPKKPAPVDQPDIVKVDPRSGQLIIPLGGLVAWTPDLPAKLEDLTDVVILVSPPDTILQLRDDPTKAGRYLIKGSAPGLAQISFSYKLKGVPGKRIFEVLVQPDLALLRAVIKRTIPTAAVEVQPGLGVSVVLSGYVVSPQDAEIVMRLATAAVGGREAAVINAVQVGGVQQVQIDVVVASVDRNMLRVRGLDFSVNGTTVTFQSIISGLITPPTVSSSGAPGTLTVSNAANLQLGVLPAGFFTAMQALRSEGVAKFLAEPKVVTQTGKAAFFRAGGQQATLSASSGITGPGVQYVPFGTELEVLPIVYGNGQIWLEINPRITAISAALGITVGGALSPGFTEQQVRSSVMLESGQTFAIGGLIQNTVQTSCSKVPFLGDLPFVGIGFSTITHSQIENELLIMVTPRLVGPMNCDQVPKRVPGRETRNPDDYELFLENIMESPRGQRKVWNGRCYNASYKCDPTAAIFPCVGGLCTGRVGPVVPGTLAPVQTLAPSTLPPIPPQPMPGGGSSAIPQQMPSGSTSALPVVPGMPVGDIVLSAEQQSQQPNVMPASLPPVIVLPEVPRN